MREAQTSLQDKPTWLNVDLSFLLPFLAARAFASAAAAAAIADDDFLADGFFTFGGTFLKPPCSVEGSMQCVHDIMKVKTCRYHLR